MEYTILANKRILDGMVDLQDQTWDNSNEMNLLDVFTVTSDMEMRWDKIANKYYGQPSLSDALYKFNEYDNPLSVKEGDIIYIPVKSDLDKGYKKDNTKNTFDSEVVVKTISGFKQKDKNRLDFLKKKEVLLPPSFSKVEQSKTYNSDGTITLTN